MVHTPTAPGPPPDHRGRGRCVYTGGVARVNIYLPDDLFAAVHARKLPVSKVCQRALRAELERHTRHGWKPPSRTNPPAGPRPATPPEAP